MSVENKDVNGWTRRKVLRSAGGVMMGLPFLESLGGVSYGASAGGAKRLVAINIPLGLHAPALFPEKAGSDYEATEYLKVLDGVRDELTLIGGLSHPGVGGGHSASNRILTGVPNVGAGKKGNGESLDQFVAHETGKHTRFSSLVMGMTKNTDLSWYANGMPVPVASKMSDVFTKLFSEEGSKKREDAKQYLGFKGSVLDAVMEQAKSLESKLSSTDKEKVEEYFHAVRETEKRVEKEKEWIDIPKPKVDADSPEDPKDKGEFLARMGNLFEVSKLALMTDSTRVVTFDLFEQNRVNIDGVTNGYHMLSHHGKDPENVRQLKLVEKAMLGEIGKFVQGLRDTKMGDGHTLLDETAVLVVSNLGNGNNHHVKDLPVLLFGGGFKHGQYLDFVPRNTTPLCNLYLSLAHWMGVKAERFGTSDGGLKGIA